MDTNVSQPVGRQMDIPGIEAFSTIAKTHVNTRIDNSMLNTELKEAVDGAFQKHGYDLVNILRKLS